MKSVTLQPGADQTGFRGAVRRLMADGVPPDDVVWSASPGLFAEEEPGAAAPLSLPGSRLVAGADLLQQFIAARLRQSAGYQGELLVGQLGHETQMIRAAARCKVPYCAHPYENVT